MLMVFSRTLSHITKTILKRKKIQKQLQLKNKICTYKSNLRLQLNRDPLSKLKSNDLAYKKDWGDLQVEGHKDKQVLMIKKETTMEHIISFLE